LRMGVLREISPSESISLWECESRPLVTPQFHDRATTAWYVCHDDRCEAVHTIPRDRLRRWAIDVPRLAVLLSAAIGADGLREEVPGRVFELGVVGPRKLRRVAFFLIGGSWDDGADVLDAAPRFAVARSPILFVPSQPPRPEQLRRADVTIVCLDCAFELQGECLSIPYDGIDGSSDNDMMTVTDSAKLLVKDFAHLTLQLARARVSSAASRGQFRTNGERGAARRIERVSFDAWRLRVRDADLDREDD
jgi:hypothetical protein